MADTIRAGFQDIPDVRRDFESVKAGLGRELTALLRSEADTVARATKPFTPLGPGPTSAKDNLPHIADTISGAALPTGAAVVTTHPGGPVLEYGGTISPRGHPITFKQHAMAHKAGEAQLPRLERDVTQRINDLLRTHGL